MPLLFTVSVICQIHIGEKFGWKANPKYGIFCHSCGGEDNNTVFRHLTKIRELEGLTMYVRLSLSTYI